MLLLIAECSFIKKKFLLHSFSNESSKIDHQWNFTTTLFCKASQNSFSKILYQSSKISPSRHVVPVHGCNLRLLPDNCNA